MAPKTPDVQDDYYELLGIDKKATEAEIKTAFKKLALKYHPDRNQGNEEALEHFKKISVAYSVLVDPNKRRQYDISGPSGNSVLDFEGFDVSEMGGVGRVFGALFNKLGVPIPTSIVPKVLAQARHLSENSQCDISAVRLSPGQPVAASIGKQEGAFYTIDITDEYKRNGVSIVCKSSSSSKFKLVIFDKEGGVRMIESINRDGDENSILVFRLMVHRSHVEIMFETSKNGLGQTGNLQESQKCKSGTQANFFFIPYAVASIGEFNPLKHHMEDKETPLPFHYLDTLEIQSAELLEPREHLLCVYGDNWLNAVKYNITFLPIASDKHELMTEISEAEKSLATKKQEMATFQAEFMKVKKQYEEMALRLSTDDKEIQLALKTRETKYKELVDGSQSKYNTQGPVKLRESGNIHGDGRLGQS